jgi:hypothetical protein
MEAIIFILLSLCYLWGATIALRSQRTAEGSFFISVSICYAALAVNHLLIYGYPTFDQLAHRVL